MIAIATFLSSFLGSLQLAHQRASEILLSGYLINPFPVFISANRFDKSTSFLHIICDTLQCDLADAEDYLISGKCWLLIDGINEISLGDQEAAFREIERLITSNDETPILLTSRKYNFQAKFGLPVYELLPLTDELVLDFLQKNMKSKDIGQRFFDRLTSSENLLLDFARNPLMLRMLTQVARKDDIPENKGQLFRQFTRWIFSRETRFRKFSANPFFIELVLATIAFKMRSEGKINSPHAIVIDWVAKVVKDLRATSDATQLFHELLDSHILELDLNDGVTFFHELIQEYFCALELKRLYLQNPKSIMDFYLLPIWFEPIAMLSGLLDKAETLIADILPFNIRLAAKCVWSGASVSEATIADIIHYSENIVLDALKNAPPRNDIKRNAYISLLEVGTPESLKTTIRLLSIDDKFSLTTALTSCERPEIATVKLLRFGLTGHKRVFQCLSALRGKTLSSTILNSPEVAAAELKLLEGEIETRSIALIAEIGIPVSIKQDVRVVVSKIVSDFDATDAKWRAAIVIAANEGFTDEILDMITERFSVLKASGQLYYSMFIVCTSLKSKEKQLELAISSARSCLRLQLYGLAIKYISHFNLAKIILFSEIKDQIEKLAFEGRLQLLIEFENAYSNDFTPYVQTAVNKRLQDFTINDMKYIEIFAEKHPNKMEPLIAQKQDLIKNKLISLGKRGHRPRVLRKFIRVLNLQNLFVGVGVIRWFIRKKGYGFISDLNTDRVIFFHMSRVTNRSLLNELRPRMLVAYSFSESSTHPGKLRANSVTVL